MSPDPQVYITPRDKFSDLANSKRPNDELPEVIAWDSSESDEFGKAECEILTSMNDDEDDPEGEEDEMPTRNKILTKTYFFAKSSVPEQVPTI